MFVICFAGWLILPSIFSVLTYWSVLIFIFPNFINCNSSKKMYYFYFFFSLSCLYKINENQCDVPIVCKWLTRPALGCPFISFDKMFSIPTSFAFLLFFLVINMKRYQYTLYTLWILFHTETTQATTTKPTNKKKTYDFLIV